MDVPNSIINAGDITKPVDTLIRKISNAIGGIFEPFQIKRIAKAEAEAEIIKATTQIQINELQVRAFKRFLSEEGKKQQNIESITNKAIQLVKEDAKPENIDDDWITHFFDRCRLISDEEMQNLWSKILAGESNAPGKFSKRTINILSTMDKIDAELFTKFCKLTVNIKGEKTPIIYNFNNQIYKDNEISFSAFLHLVSIGLIQMENDKSYIINEESNTLKIEYFDRSILIKDENRQKLTFDMGNVIFTSSGNELAEICTSKPPNGYFEFLEDKWKKLGYKVEVLNTEEK